MEAEKVFLPAEQIYMLICRNDGITASEIAKCMRIPRSAVNRLLYLNPWMHELCYTDSKFKWHGLIRQAVPHEGLYEFSGWYGMSMEFLNCNEQEWLEELRKGCHRIGRNLNDQRGLIHSFKDTRQTVQNLFTDMKALAFREWAKWELVFEFRVKLARRIRIYADVLLITKDVVFSLEFKMKDQMNQTEVAQAAKYAPYLQVIFGSGVKIIPVLVLTGAADLFQKVTIRESGQCVRIVSGDMLFNVIDEQYMFLR